MKYYLKENFRFLYADGVVYDQNEGEKYSYENTTIFFPQINLYKDGQLIGFVKKRFTWFLRKYDIYFYDQYIDSINQQLKFFKNELLLEEMNWKVKGDFFSLHYEIFNEYDEVVARVDQEIFRLTQRFNIEIFDENNEDMIMLLILAINQFDKDLQAAASSASVSSSGN